MKTYARFVAATGALFVLVFAAPAASGAKKWQHAPYGAGACETCHRTARPSNAVLKASVEKVCTGCHDEFADQMAARRYKHDSLSSCVGCHSPHEAGDKRLLKASVSKVCADCHEKTSPSCTKKRSADACVGCHDPHASNRAKLLR